ncbi:DUF4358 domain-containing protein [Acetobacterium sp.]|jgi:hypothetical protein|uniref:DUF4358 domain-containing protein n=1 Tax=Acetobacterium sp. TaxID=1872094 RepID=UPI000CC66626|nr:DUF4358 domain-containing protein [Acetobacterium sp.]MDO9491306.1 DUF4358 domain-containing protein [Acetobacterium sp.]PKM71151.1 MAG: hypothetical protein CVU92_09935 [Firmicutes bacterium HGW-Firmicutes-17]
MKKFAVLLFILILALPCFGCHSAEQPPLSQVETDLLAASQNLSGMEKGDGKALKRYYGLNINDYQEALIYVPANYMDVSELLVIKVNDPAQLDLVEAAVDNRNAMQQESFDGYGPEQVALLDNYEFKIVGNTLFYCVSPDASTLKDTFVKSIKKNQ